jgi:4a-hydroxytetrahydrobiopterin dehydratase
MEKLSPDQIEERIADVPQWSINGDLLQRTLGFEDFNGAIAFVNRLRDLAEGMQHHPDIMIRYNKVTLTLTTHDAGGLTEKDFSFARAVDGCVPATKT